MQALFILPLLMSVLAAAISLLASFWPGAILAVDLARLSAVQAIIAADAGEKARTESAAAITSFFIGNLVVENGTSALLAVGIRNVHQQGFETTTLLCDP